MPTPQRRETAPDFIIAPPSLHQPWCPLAAAMASTRPCVAWPRRAADRAQSGAIFARRRGPLAAATTAQSAPRWSSRPPPSNGSACCTVVVLGANQAQPQHRLLEQSGAGRLGREASERPVEMDNPASSRSGLSSRIVTAEEDTAVKHRTVHFRLERKLNADESSAGYCSRK